MCFAIRSIGSSLTTFNVQIPLCLAMLLLMPIANGCKKEEESAPGSASNQTDNQEDEEVDDDRRESFNCSMAEMSNRLQPRSARSETYVREIQVGQMTSVISQITELIHSPGSDENHNADYESISFDHYENLNEWVASLPINSIKLWPDDLETDLAGAEFIVRIRIRQQFDHNDSEANSTVMSRTMESILARFHSANTNPESTDDLVDAAFSHATVSARVIGNSEEHYLVEAICFFPPPMVADDDDSDTSDEDDRR